MSNTKIITGTANPQLAKQIAQKLKLSLSRIEVGRFSDGEIRVELMENMRGSKTYVIQPICNPVNDNLMELVLITDALKRAAADKVIAVVPYYGYARQDRRPGYSRVPISARVIADLLQAVGVDHLITCDLHAMQIQGFFKIPVDNISATQLFVADIYKTWMDDNPIIVSPDTGGVARARGVAKHLGLDLAIVDKRRPKANVAEVMNIIGDVVDKTCIIIDDLVDTAGTLAKGANALIDVGGARQVVAYSTHGVLSGDARKNVSNSKLKELVVTDTIAEVRTPLTKLYDKVRYIPMANTLAEVIARVEDGRSVSEFLE